MKNLFHEKTQHVRELRIKRNRLGFNAAFNGFFETDVDLGPGLITESTAMLETCFGGVIIVEAFVAATGITHFELSVLFGSTKREFHGLVIAREEVGSCESRVSAEFLTLIVDRKVGEVIVVSGYPVEREARVRNKSLRGRASFCYQTEAFA